ncbi:MAG: helix-turn-helix transcriptional regulator [Planctomycetes bacterium]|nr:helix-turn-helix transcriptional regulator [Planctomycetota bacterium]MCC7168934.1 helix-turn-helix transcriptional regulator [Planctomycetota bacterium]
MRGYLNTQVVDQRNDPGYRPGVKPTKKTSKSTPKRTVAKASKPPLSDAALALVARRFKALSDPSRLALLQQLMAGERSVGDLARAVAMTHANVSRHLTLLTTEGLLARRKDGLFVHYSIADPCVEQLCELVCTSLTKRFDGARGALPD